MAASFAALRTVDPCALLVAAAVDDATGGTATQPRPGPHLGDCGLGATSNGAPIWEFRVSVGTSLSVVPSVYRHEFVEGLEVYLHSQDGHQTCEVYRPTSNEHAITLTVWNLGVASKPACTTARLFLTAAMATWRTLPKRAQAPNGHVATLATRDPCEPARAILDVLGRLDGTTDPTAIYSCIVYPRPKGRSGPSVGGPITVTFTIDTDPALDIEGGIIEPVMIAGIAGAQIAARDRKCSVRIAHDRRVVASIGGDQLLQILGVKADSCAIAAVAAVATHKTLTN